VISPFRRRLTGRYEATGILAKWLCQRRNFPNQLFRRFVSQKKQSALGLIPHLSPVLYASSIIGHGQTGFAVAHSSGQFDRDPPSIGAKGIGDGWRPNVRRSQLTDPKKHRCKVAF
jgi:hypothetical protein